MKLSTPLDLVKDFYTPEDLPHLGSDALVELIDGELFELQVDPVSSEAVGHICARLHEYLDRTKFGTIFLAQSFQCFPHDRTRVRRPDLCIIEEQRARYLPDDTEHVPFPPDLAIEVIASTDTVCYLDEKLADYRKAGFPLIWVINPRSRVIRVHRSDGSITEVGESGVLSGEAALPGFSVRVENLLPVLSYCAS